MKRIGASFIPILALGFAACTGSCTGPDPVKSCTERKAGLYEEVAEFTASHPSQDARITVLRPYPSEIDLQYMNGPNGVEIVWIPPVGFNPVSGEVLNSIPMDTASQGVETSTLELKPAETSLVQVVSTGRYVATVRISDSANRLVREFTQNFGYHGELNNRNRVTPKGLASYLVWNNRNLNGRLVADGAYLWRIGFTFKDGTEYQIAAKTGIFKTACPVE
jgi:hypothetical protein